MHGNGLTVVDLMPLRSIWILQVSNHFTFVGLLLTRIDMLAKEGL